MSRNLESINIPLYFILIQKKEKKNKIENSQKKL